MEDLEKYQKVAIDVLFMLLPEFRTFVAVVLVFGFKSLFCYLWSLFSQSTWYICKKRNVNTYARYGKQGQQEQKDKSWALVTGASDGIGLATCKELAKRGFNIILLARNAEKLQKTADDVKKSAPAVLTKIIVQDLSKPSTY
jgi:hypothetical protein